MAERPEDLNLPNTVIQRIIKETMPTNVSVSKEARQVLSRAASVFVLYVTSCANTNAMKNKRKTLTGNDVLSALEDLEYDSFLDPLRKLLEAYKSGAMRRKKDSKASTNEESGLDADEPAAVDSESSNESDSVDMAMHEPGEEPVDT